MKTVEINNSNPSEFSSALHAKCPRCRQGNIFATPMYGFKLQKMHDNCPHCNLKFEREPGYFYVAMFVSYAMNVAEMISLCVATYVFTGYIEFWLYLSVIVLTVLLLAPFNYRYSRVILLYWLTPRLHYDPESNSAGNDNPESHA